MFDPVSIDAEYMEKWLGGRKISSLTPKVLSDIQKLMEHYKDIIVPFEDVKVSFPTEGNSAYCSVEKGEVFVSTGDLVEGEVDTAIGCMIHELHHIKMSDSERQTWATCFKFVCNCLRSMRFEIEGEELSGYEMVMRGTPIHFKDIYSEQPSCEKTAFLSKACKDVAFLLNAVEDVRIDSNTPTNLKKYIDKGDAKSYHNHFKKRYEGGELDELNLHNICFRLLFHHKGFYKDPVIEERFGSRSAIVDAQPKDLIPYTLNEWKSEIRDHLADMFSEGMTVTGLTPMEKYLAGLSAEHGESDLLKELELGEEGVTARAESDTEQLNMDTLQVEIGKKEKPKGITLDNKQKYKLIPKALKADIDSMRNIQVVACNEALTNSYGDDATPIKREYAVVVIDGTN
jgi:hypothetical protein